MLTMFVSVRAFPTTQESSLASSPHGPFTPFGAKRPSLSSAYMVQQSVSCLRLFAQLTCCPLFFALESAGISKLARIAIIAITTSSSIKLNPRGHAFLNHTVCIETTVPKMLPSNSLHNCTSCRTASLPLVLAFAYSLQNCEPGIFRIRNRQRLELGGRIDLRNDFADRFAAKRALGQRRAAGRSPQAELTAANLAVAVTKLVFVNPHASSLRSCLPHINLRLTR